MKPYDLKAGKCARGVAIALLGLALLAGCSNNDEYFDDNTSAAPTPSPAPTPTPVQDAFFAAVAALAANSPDDTEPAGIDAIAETSPEESEPQPLG